VISNNMTTDRELHSMLYRLPLIAFACAFSILAAVLPSRAQAQRASPREAECHAEATKRYINDFRQLGASNQDAQESVVVLVNEKRGYDAYYAQCLGRWNSVKVR
jgi:hypothetical protein